MTFDDEIRLQFEQCMTLSELKAAVRRVLIAHGKDERLLKPVLLSFFGGTVVRVDSQGVPLNLYGSIPRSLLRTISLLIPRSLLRGFLFPWRRKFLPQN